MKTILAENKHGTGAKKSFLGHTLRRALVREKLGKSGIPYDWPKTISRTAVIKNQGQSSSCGGQAKSYWLESVLGIVPQSAKSIYSSIYYPGGGTTVPALEKDLGSADETVVPSYQNGQLPTEEWMESNSWKTPDNLKNTLSKKGWIPISVKIDIESMAEAIRDHGGFIWEIEAKNNGTWLSNHPMPPTNNGDIWTHFMCSQGVGMWNGEKAINMFQSWGTDVGDRGIQHFTEDYINSGYIIDCFTFVKAPKYQFTADFGYGSWRFQDVFNLQKILISLGFGTFTPTGLFGPLTLSSVKSFQLAHNIPTTGWVGPLTRGILSSF